MTGSLSETRRDLDMPRIWWAHGKWLCRATRVKLIGKQKIEMKIFLRRRSSKNLLITTKIWSVWTLPHKIQRKREQRARTWRQNPKPRLHLKTSNLVYSNRLNQADRSLIRNLLMLRGWNMLPTPTKRTKILKAFSSQILSIIQDHLRWVNPNHWWQVRKWPPTELLISTFQTKSREFWATPALSRLANLPNQERL